MVRWLDGLTDRHLRQWLDCRRTRWQTTTNPHLLINRTTAAGGAPVSRNIVHAAFARLGVTAHRLRGDRFLDEVDANGALTGSILPERIWQAWGCELTITGASGDAVAIQRLVSIAIATRYRYERKFVDFQVFDLREQKRGAVVVVSLQGNAANVRLMDSSNYQAYRKGRRHRYSGGLVKKSPVRVVVPRNGHWYVTVDLTGMKPGAKVRASVEVESPPLPAARSASHASLSNVRVERPPTAVVEQYGSWDVFISHASEDKDEIARPLYKSLTSLGVKVWFDEAELGIGDSLRRKIDHGLLRSAFGVVVFSQAFFAKGWPQYELDGIVTRTVAGEQNLLPVWHNMTRDEIWAKSPSLADKIGRSTAAFSVDEIASEIAERVRPDLLEEKA